MSYDSKLVNFLSNGNTIKVSGIRDFKSLDSLLKKIGIKLFPKGEEDFWYCVNNFKLPNAALSFLVEYNNSKGLCLGWHSEEDSKQWFGIKPYTVKEILEQIKGA